MLRPCERRCWNRGLQMLKLLCRWLPAYELVVWATIPMQPSIFWMVWARSPVTVLVRLRLDAALYEPAPRTKGRGRPRQKRQRSPTLSSALSDPTTVWQPVEVDWHDGQCCEVQITCFWVCFRGSRWWLTPSTLLMPRLHHAGLSGMPNRWSPSPMP